MTRVIDEVEEYIITRSDQANLEQRYGSRQYCVLQTYIFQTDFASCCNSLSNQLAATRFEWTPEERLEDQREVDEEHMAGNSNRDKQPGPIHIEDQREQHFAPDDVSNGKVGHGTP